MSHPKQMIVKERGEGKKGAKDEFEFLKGIIGVEDGEVGDRV